MDAWRVIVKPPGMRLTIARHTSVASGELLKSSLLPLPPLSLPLSLPLLPLPLPPPLSPLPLTLPNAP